jgi:hypothetical protein
LSGFSLGGVSVCVHQRRADDHKLSAKSRPLRTGTVDEGRGCDHEQQRVQQARLCKPVEPAEGPVDRRSAARARRGGGGNHGAAYALGTPMRMSYRLTSASSALRGRRTLAQRRPRPDAPAGRPAGDVPRQDVHQQLDVASRMLKQEREPCARVP